MFCNLGSKIWVSCCNLSVKGTVSSLSRVSHLVYPKANTASARHQEEFLDTVLLCFAFCLNQLRTHLQLLLQVCCTFFNNQHDLLLTWFPFQSMPAAPLVPFSGVLGREKQEPASRLAWENLNSRTSPAQALQTETWSWRESEQPRSVRPTLLIKHPIQLFYYFDVLGYNPNTKLHWAISCVTAIPVSALRKVWTSISKRLKDTPP